MTKPNSNFDGFYYNKKDNNNKKIKRKEIKAG